jgi:hypothetical protein
MTIQAEFLIPVVRDSDKSRHAKKVWQKLYDRLLTGFGGYTAAGVVDGVWQDESGKIIHDKSRRFIVAVPENKTATLRELLADCCKLFDQQVIYSSVGGNIQFVR